MFLYAQLMLLQTRQVLNVRDMCYFQSPTAQLFQPTRELKVGIGLEAFPTRPSSLECAGHLLFLKFNPTPSLISDPGSTFPTLRRQRAETR